MTPGDGRDPIPSLSDGRFADAFMVCVRDRVPALNRREVCPQRKWKRDKWKRRPELAVRRQAIFGMRHTGPVQRPLADSTHARRPGASAAVFRLSRAASSKIQMQAAQPQ